MPPAEQLDNNPLWTDAPQPVFDDVRAEHVEPAINRLLEELAGRLDELERRPADRWEELVHPLEEITNRLEERWGVVLHLMSVRNDDALRAAQEAVQPKVVQFGMRLAQSRAIYERLRALRESADWSDSSAARRRVVGNYLRDAELAGVALEDAERERFNAIQTELADLSTRFQNNVMDAVKAFEMVLTDHSEVAGLPQSALALAAQSARQAGHQDADEQRGPWRFTLDGTSVTPFLEHARRRDLRERLYRAYVTRASSGEVDNLPVVERELELRREAARLLGYSNPAEVSMAAKMAGSVEAVQRLQDELARAARPAAERDVEELCQIAERHGAPEAQDMRMWDAPFWAERLREERFGYKAEELRPYFPFERVLSGLFDLSTTLFGIRVESADGQAPIWHPDVRYFRVQDSRGEQIASFYLDPFARPEEKRGGAWMDAAVHRCTLGDSPRLPIAYLTCNGAPPVDGKPSLMTFSEVNTLFHEFGHGLQHMLTTTDEGLVAGIRGVEWDAVELASQFMENWLYQKGVIDRLSGHYETGEPLPAELFEKVVATRTFQTGRGLLRQLYFGTLDMELHANYEARGETVLDVQRRVAERMTIIRPIPENRFLCAFLHLFAGSYGAGYYSYKWAEVLSADVFAAFEEAGIEDEAALARVGAAFRDSVLALGGSQHPMEVFRSFRGREPSTAPLLRHLGLADSA